jgi:hypothetical protein
MWDPRRLTTLWAFMPCYRDSFTFLREWKLNYGLQFVLPSLPIMLALRTEKRLAKDITVTISAFPVSKVFFKDCRLLLLVVMGQFGLGCPVNTSEVREAIVRNGQ